MGPDCKEAETSISVRDPYAPIFEYPGMLLLSLALRPKGREIVMLGLGGGFVPRLCQKFLPDHFLTVVEIDPLVVELARTYFGFSEGGNVKVAIADGLDYLSKLPSNRLDFIWLDAFDGFYIPAHLSTENFLEVIRRVLRLNGLLTQNLHQNHAKRYREQLIKTVQVFDEPPLLLCGSRCSNSILVSPNGPKPIPREKDELIKAVKSFGSKIGPYDLLKQIDKETPLPNFVYSMANFNNFL
jgi:spermidine synthase